MRTNKKLRTVIVLMTIFCFTQNIASQKKERNFNQILQTYYLKKDNKLLQHSLDYFNNNNLNINKINSLFIGFYGGLFLQSSTIKNEFKNNINQFKDKNIQNILIILTTKDIKKVMRNYPVSPSLNDMNWAAFFSTSKTEYIDNILKNSSEIDNRIDLNLFLTGASAKLSLCSNSRQHIKVKKHLETTLSYRELAKEILKSNPADFKKNIVKTIKDQRKKGIWNK